jgi:hypothetical protein
MSCARERQPVHRRYVAFEVESPAVSALVIIAYPDLTNEQLQALANALSAGT